MDEDFRRALRYGTLDELKRVSTRAPAEVLAEAYAQLDAEFNDLKGKLAAIGVIAPRCHCGEIGEPYCLAHRNSVEEYLVVRNVHANMGMLARWANGEDINRRDMRQLVLLHQAAGNPDARGCQFPTCAGQPFFSGYCQLHGQRGLPMWTRSLAKERERL